MRKLLILFVWVPLVLLPATAGAEEKGWERQWKEMVAEAKKEGKVVVMGSADPKLAVHEFALIGRPLVAEHARQVARERCG